MYPESSRIAIAKKRKRMFGRKTSTPPTPAITPSVISERRYGNADSGQMLFTASESMANPSSMYPIRGSAQVKVNQKVR